jgi:Carboxypeptidase regulatory-like domain
MHRYLALAFLALACFVSNCAAQSNSNGAVHGSVVDPSGATVKGATVEIQNPVSQYQRTTVTDAQGSFGFDNIPFNNYHLSISAPSFQAVGQDLSIRVAVPVELKISLSLGPSTTTVNVTEAGDLLETDSTSHTDVDRALFQRLPLESSSSSLSSLVTLASPGISADSNGLFHGLGDHASNSFSLDDQPITDQQSKVFSNQIHSIRSTQWR